MEPILLYDTTLRDGTQGENVSFSAEEKLKIALRLDDIGIHYIEGGWPGRTPRTCTSSRWRKRRSSDMHGWRPSAVPAGRASAWKPTRT